LLLQAGAFGEHAFTEVERLDGEEGKTTPVNDKHFEVILPPGCQLPLKLRMRRYCHTPSYAQPINN
jgi:hypothetical protein